MDAHAIPMGLGDEEDLLDPHPDIHALFMHYNALYFEGTLDGPVSVEWSTSRMTRCAGVCKYSPLGGARIVLSMPLLQLRPTRDLKETLLHEMVHAYNFVHKLRDSDPGGHGEPFQRKMHEINTSTRPDSQRPLGGYNITVCHSMVDEVRSYQTHVWNCSKCGNEIRRAMNRRPQPADCRTRMGDACNDPYCLWHTHLRSCGGEYVKVSEPPPKKPKRAGTNAAQRSQAAGAAGPSTSAAPARAPKRQRLPQNRPITAFFQPADKRESMREVLAAAAERRAKGDIIDLTR